LVPNYAESGLDSDKIPGQRKNVLREKAELDETLIDYRVYKGVDEKGFPKDYILEIPNKKEREICKLYWIEDLEQKDIVSELKVTKQYVSRIINKHKSRR
jgi:DNA-directed RNA polymerase specialized sigma subunit